MKRNPFEELREKMLASAKAGIKEAYSSEEYALIQSINAYLETEKSYNLVYERLTEWYGIYFPEIRVSSASTLAALALAVNSDTLSYDLVFEAVKDETKAKQIYEKAKSTIGRKPNADEKEAVISFAEMSQAMKETLDSLEDYIGKASNKILPNVTFLTEPKIAAEMLSKAGSMERFATMPASTVQLLGAEKSLFKHLKFGSNPPKYGVLFKLPAINTLQRDIRGKVARAYATKICIALKADYYTKNDIGKTLKYQLDAIIERIKTEEAKNPKANRPKQPQRPEGQRKEGGRQGHFNRQNRGPRRPVGRRER